MPRYDSSKPTPDGQPPEKKDAKGFYSFFIPAAGNAIQAAKWSADEAAKEDRTDRADPRKSKQDYLNDAHSALDACDKKLDQAKEDTERRIAKRDKGRDEPERRGWLW